MDMDEDLKNAAIKGDVEFLKHVVASDTPVDYFKSLYNPRDPDSEQEGNIFHLAAWNKRTEFLTEAMKMLDTSLVQFLLYQQDSRGGETPLHVASWKGYNKIVKEILNYFEKSLSASSSSSTAQSADSPYTLKPWLIKNNSDRTPFHYMMSECREECALKLLSMYADFFSIMVEGDRYGGSPFVHALARGFNRVVLKFFNSAPDSFWATVNRHVLIRALGSAPNCSDEIFRLVLEKNLQLLEDKEIFDQHILEILGDCLIKWADKGKLYPFEYVLKSYDHAPHLRRCLIDLIRQQHILKWIAHTPNCDEDTKVQIAKIIVDTYKKEKREELNFGQLEVPWLLTYDGLRDCLYHVVDERKEKLALYLLSLDVAKSLLGKEGQILFLAIEKNCRQVANEILDLVHQHDITTLLTSSTGQTILHNAPKCKDKLILKKLVERHSYLVGQSDDDGVNVLHSWIEIGELWPFQYVLKSNDIDHDFRKKLIGLLDEYDDRGRNPLHVAAEFGASGAIEPIVQLLLNAYQEFGLTGSRAVTICETPYSDYNLPLGQFLVFKCMMGPWSHADNEGNTPQRKAITAGREQLALLLLSPQRFNFFYFGNQDILFTAIEKKCHHVVKYFLDVLYQGGFETALLCFSGKNILHIASKCSEANGKLIIERWPHLINQPDPNGKTPLQIASEEGASWLVKLIIEKDPTSILKAPNAWVEACKRGDLSTVLTFVESTYFKYVCQKHHDTPLHHVKFDTYNKYQELLKCPLMDELKNVQDSEGNTPLHKAIKDRNKELTEILFTKEDIYCNIKNNDQKTAMDLLEEASEDQEWANMCKRLTFNRHKKDLREMRKTTSFVAALVATITFAAGFTLPGGYNSETGEAILSKRIAFLVFLITDAYAVCCSMLILLNIMWSKDCDPDTSSFLVERNWKLLKQSLYGTLLAFMNGIYIVTYKRSFWSAIVVIVMCSIVIIIAQIRAFGYASFYMLNSLDEKAGGIRMRLMSCLQSLSVKQQAVPPNNQSQDEEATPLTNQSEHKEISPLNNQSQDKEAVPIIDQRDDQKTQPLSNMLEMSNYIAGRVHRIQKRLSLCVEKWTAFVNSVFRGKQQAVLPNNQSQDEEAASLTEREDQKTRPLSNQSQDEEAAGPLSEQSESRLDSIV